MRLLRLLWQNCLRSRLIIRTRAGLILPLWKGRGIVDTTQTKIYPSGNDGCIFFIQSLRSAVADTGLGFTVK